MGLIQLYVEPFTLKGCPNHAKHLGSLRKFTIYFFSHFAKNNWAFCKNILKIIFLDARICFGHYGNFMQPDNFGQVIQIERNFTFAQKFGHLGKILMFKKISNKTFLGCSINFRQFWNLPNNVGHIINVTNFQFCSQKCQALSKNLDDPKRKKQYDSLRIKKIIVDNFGQIIMVKNRFHCYPKSQATWKNVQKFSKLAKNLSQFVENLRKCFQGG